MFDSLTLQDNWFLIILWNWTVFVLKYYYDLMDLNIFDGFQPIAMISKKFLNKLLNFRIVSDLQESWEDDRVLIHLYPISPIINLWHYNGFCYN